MRKPDHFPRKPKHGYQSRDEHCHLCKEHGRCFAASFWFMRTPLISGILRSRSVAQHSGNRRKTQNPACMWIRRQSDVHAEGKSRSRYDPLCLSPRKIVRQTRIAALQKIPNESTAQDRNARGHNHLIPEAAAKGIERRRTSTAACLFEEFETSWVSV